MCIERMTQRSSAQVAISGYQSLTQWVLVGKNPTHERFVHYYRFSLKKVAPLRGWYSGEIMIVENTALDEPNSEGVEELRANHSVADSWPIGQCHQRAPYDPDRSGAAKLALAQRNFGGESSRADRRQMLQPAQDIQIERSIRASVRAVQGEGNRADSKGEQMIGSEAQFGMGKTNEAAC